MAIKYHLLSFGFVYYTYNVLVHTTIVPPDGYNEFPTGSFGIVPEFTKPT